LLKKIWTILLTLLRDPLARMASYFYWNAQLDGFHREPAPNISGAHRAALLAYERLNADASDGRRRSVPTLAIGSPRPARPALRRIRLVSPSKGARMPGPPGPHCDAVQRVWSVHCIMYTA
jgi:hypothetical protein